MKDELHIEAPLRHGADGRKDKTQKRVNRECIAT